MKLRDKINGGTVNWIDHETGDYAVVRYGQQYWFRADGSIIKRKCVFCENDATNVVDDDSQHQDHVCDYHASIFLDYPNVSIERLTNWD